MSEELTILTTKIEQIITKYKLLEQDISKLREQNETLILENKQLQSQCSEQIEKIETSKAVVNNIINKINQHINA